MTELDLLEYILPDWVLFAGEELKWINELFHQSNLTVNTKQAYQKTMHHSLAMIY